MTRTQKEALYYHSIPSPSSIPSFPMSAETPRIAILVDSSTSWGRRTIRGILDYTLQHGPWDIWIDPKGQNEKFTLPEGEQFDGVIARVSNKRLLGELKSRKIPVVNVSGIQFEKSRFPRVCIDQEKNAALALEHFKSRSLRHFAYVGPRHLDYVKQHERAFERAVSNSGMTCHVYENKTTAGDDCFWHPSQQRLITWLKSLPNPIGIYTWGVEVGRDLILACRKAGLQVPHDVAILGGDYDELLSDACHPALSGILTPAQQVGYQAASILHQQIQGDTVSRAPILLPPKTVVERLSTEVMAVDDPQVHTSHSVSTSTRLRKYHSGRHTAASAHGSPRPGTQIQDAPRTLSPAKEICRIRIQRARKLLAETNLTMQDIAEACGYTSYTYLGNVFQKGDWYLTGALSQRSHGLQN